jgi:exosortase/archaeosortase family protein
MKHGAIFMVVFFGLYGIYLWAEPYHTFYFNWLASSVCKILSPFDPAVRCVENVILYQGVPSLKVIEGCDGVTVFILVIAAVVAYPKPWIERIKGLLVLIPILFILNWVRLYILADIRFYLPDYFRFFHVYLFQPIMIFATFACFIAWVLHNGHKQPAD